MVSDVAITQNGDCWINSMCVGLSSFMILSTGLLTGKPNFRVKELSNFSLMSLSVCCAILNSFFSRYLRNSATLSPTIIVVVFVFALTHSGITDASAIYRFSTPSTWHLLSTTVIGFESEPIAHVLVR